MKLYVSARPQWTYRFDKERRFDDAEPAKIPVALMRRYEAAERKLRELHTQIQVLREPITSALDGVGVSLEEWDRYVETPPTITCELDDPLIRRPT